MTEHIEWFEAVLNVTVGVYFGSRALRMPP